MTRMRLYLMAVGLLLVAIAPIALTGERPSFEAQFVTIVMSVTAVGSAGYLFMLGGRYGETPKRDAGVTVGRLQPEAVHCGRISGVMEVAALARAHEVQVACHQAQSPLNTAANVHLHCTMPHFLIHECFDDFLVPWARDIFVGVPRVTNGYLEPSEAPGLGVEFNEKEAAKHPYGEDTVIQLFETGWEKRER